MIKNTKPVSDKALINNRVIRDYLIKLDSEVMRGINTLLILDIIAEFKDQATFGYNISRILQERTNFLIVMEEATLYTLLKNMEKDNLLTSRMESKRKYYKITDFGYAVYNYGIGFFASISQTLINFNTLEYSSKNRMLFCPHCANRIDISEQKVQYCIICGYFIGDKVKEHHSRKFRSPSLLSSDQSVIELPENQKMNKKEER